MIKREMNTIVFTTSVQRDHAIQQVIRNRLMNIGDLDINTLVFIALNQLTINQTVSAQLTRNADQLCQSFFGDYSYVNQQQIVSTCEQIAAVLYPDYIAAMQSARLPLPSKMISANYSCYVVSMIFESMDDQSCAWSYTTLPQ